MRYANVWNNTVLSFHRRSSQSLQLVILALILATGLFAFIPAAKAFQCGENKNFLYLKGYINHQDDVKFEKAVNQNHPCYVVLNSIGGSIKTAISIARIIHHRHLHTITDASRMICFSACTILFLAGKERLYLNTGHVTDMVFAGALMIGHGGLGFHEAGELKNKKRVYSSYGEDLAKAIYTEFGIKTAFELTKKASIDEIYTVSGKTALKLGLATSLTYP